jgi:phosphohistidine phosphatase SixA
MTWMLMRMCSFWQEEREETWLKLREVDPALSVKGELEAQKLGAWFGKTLAKGRPCRVYTSPFLRTLQTTRGVVRDVSSQHQHVLVFVV